mmetsp:Transcript_16199/g.29529  ORF Transcript_16199/g.29529 Transcript_16199/m.29529 type:complete len:100 (+) Transcript_16199:201-500(+)
MSTSQRLQSLLEPSSSCHLRNADTDGLKQFTLSKSRDCSHHCMRTDGESWSRSQDEAKEEEEDDEALEAITLNLRSPSTCWRVTLEDLASAPLHTSPFN